MSGICSWLIGAALGTSFRVHVLLPAALLGLVILAAVTAIKEVAISSALAALTVDVLALQFGYMAGVFARFCITAARTPAHQSLRSTTAQS
jgi:hypothetical protein